jgi:hypothetical protein
VEAKIIAARNICSEIDFTIGELEGLAADDGPAESPPEAP